MNIERAAVDAVYTVYKFGGAVSELIKVGLDRMVDAMEIYEFLEVKSRFNDWCLRRIDEYGWSQPADYTLLRNEYNEIIELKFTLDTAKELCMVEKTPKGRELRRYFIEIEKKYSSGVPSVYNTSTEIIVASALRLLEQERATKVLAARIDKVESRIELVASDSKYRTVRGMGNELGLSFTEKQAADIGRAASKYCKAKGYSMGKIGDERHGQVNSYPIHILKPIVESYVSGKPDKTLF